MWEDSECGKGSMSVGALLFKEALSCGGGGGGGGVATAVCLPRGSTKKKNHRNTNHS